MSVLLPPKIPYLSTPVPQRTDPEHFRPRMDLFLIEMPEVVSAINVVVDYIDQAKMDVASMEAVRDAAYQARDDAQQIKEDAEQSLTQIGEQKIADMDALTNQRIGVMEGIRDDASQSATSAAASALAAGQAAGLPEYLDGIAGKPLIQMPDGTGAQFYAGYTPFITVISTTNLVAGERYRVNTRLQSFNLILPADPPLGATIYLFDAEGTWHKNSPVLIRNGKTIMGLAEDCILDKRNASLKLVFDGSDWRVVL